MIEQQRVAGENDNKACYRGPEQTGNEELPATAQSFEDRSVSSRGEPVGGFDADKTILPSSEARRHEAEACNDAGKAHESESGRFRRGGRV